MLKQITKTQFDGLFEKPHWEPFSMAELLHQRIREVEWWTDTECQLLGVLVMDVPDNDYSPIVLTRDEEGKFRAIKILIALADSGPSPRRITARDGKISGSRYLDLSTARISVLAMGLERRNLLMLGFNQVTLLGHVCRDPELRHTPNKATPVTEVSIGINRSWIDESGTRREAADFIDVTLWGKLAETATQYLHKGSAVFIQGRLQLDVWDDKQTGQKRSRLRVIGENLQLVGERQTARQSSPSTPRPTAAAASVQPSRPAPVPDLDLDVEAPF